MVGTAINFFVLDMPRLSVDLDHVFHDRALPRDHANEAIREPPERLVRREYQVHIPEAGVDEIKLLVRVEPVEIYVEGNFVMRGTAQPACCSPLVPAARNQLLVDAKPPPVSLEELKGGKLSAALDRRHPRATWTTTKGASCCRWCGVNRIGRHSVSLISSNCWAGRRRVGWQHGFAIHRHSAGSSGTF